MGKTVGIFENKRDGVKAWENGAQEITSIEGKIRTEGFAGKTWQRGSCHNRRSTQLFYEIDEDCLFTEQQRILERTEDSHRNLKGNNLNQSIQNAGHRKPISPFRWLIELFTLTEYQTIAGNFISRG